MPLGPYALSLTELFREHKEFMNLQYNALVAAGSPSGPFPTLEQTTAALATQSSKSAATPSGPPKKPTWAAVAARK